MAFDTKFWRPQLLRLSDTVFEGMVLDNFPQVHQTFGAGQRKDAKIQVLMEYCIHLEETEQAAASDTLRDFFETQKPASLTRGNGAGGAPAFEMAHLYNFDLSDQVDKCYQYSYNDCGILGLAIPCTIPALIENLCERVCLVFGRDRVEPRKILPLNPRDTDTSEAIQLVRNEYMHRLKRKGIVFGVQNVELPVLLNFWQGLSKELQNCPLPNWMILILPVEQADWQGLPAEIVPLDKPTFKIADVDYWVREVARQFDLDDEMIRHWIHIVMKRYLVHRPPAQPELDITGIYSHFESMISFLQENPTKEEIREELDYWS